MRPVTLSNCVLLALGLAVAACENDLADSTPKGDERRAERDRSLPAPAPTLRPRRPPEEAYAACAGLERGARCSVTLPERTLSGSCRPLPSGDDKLACLPPDRGPGELSGRELERKLDRLEREILGT